MRATGILDCASVEISRAVPTCLIWINARNPIQVQAYRILVKDMSIMPQALGTNDDDIAPGAIAGAAQLITSPRLGILLSYWHQIRGMRLMPGWQDLDPAEIVPALPLVWAWSYDRDTERFTSRLAGEEVRHFVDRPLLNAPMQDCFEPAAYAVVFARHKRVIDEPAIAVEWGQVFLCNGRVGFGERLILPLAKDGQHADMIIGATSYQLQSGQPGHGALPRANIRVLHPAAGGTETQFFPL